jgi:murein DD-endopeptidase MepM/ murein hydrolase activator NlpD
MSPRMRRALLSSCAASVVATALIALPHLSGAPERTAPTAEAAVRLRLVFPVKGHAVNSANYGACRSGCRRRHLGVDIMGHKGQPLLAAGAGRITALRLRRSGNYLTITTPSGWSFNYLHINNDLPGTDNGRNLRRYAFAPGITRGAWVDAGQVIAYMGDSGNAEQTAPHLHFEIRRGYGWTGKPVNPSWSLQTARRVR